MNTIIYKNINKALTFNKSMLFLFCLLTKISTIAQNIQYDAFPMPSQIFQRDDNNKAIVPVNGRIFTDGYTDISLLVKRDKKNYFWKKQKLSYQTANPKSAAFAFDTEIKAELSEYSYYLYLFKGNDSTLVKEQNEIICGDIIIIYGQSNALASDPTEVERLNGDNKFGRTAFGNFTNNEFLWLPTQKWNFWSAGLLGLEIQKQLIDKYKIPVGIVNGSEGNKSIKELMLRDENAHNSTNTIYGRLLKKSEGLGFAKKAKILVWRQGESEALDTNYKNDYPKNFDIFRKELLEDYPSLKKIYTFQNNIYFGGQALAGEIRDYQRSINKLYANCEAIATFGTVTFETLHYKLEGYQQSGEEVSRLIARDFFKSSDTLEINSPNIKSAYFTQKKDSLILEFDKAQKLFFPPTPANNSANNISLDLKDYIYLNGKAGNIASATGINNHVVLKLKTLQTVQTVGYTPDFYTVEMLNYMPGLPQIVNSRKVRAFTFKNFPVTTLSNMELKSLAGKWDETTKGVTLNWDIPKYVNYTYYVEKAIYSPTYFTEIGTANTAIFKDYKVKKSISYFYRIRIKSDGLMSAYSNIIEVKPPVIDSAAPYIESAEELMMFPNPVQRGEQLKLDALFDKPIKEIQLININGNIVEAIIGETAQHQYFIKTDNLNAGVYLIEAILADNTKLIKKFVVE